MKQKIKGVLLISLFGFGFIGCTPAGKNLPPVTFYKSQIFQLKFGGFGYDIFKDSLLLIHQPVIPGVQGSKGFSNRTDAKKVAELMILKIENGIMPPSVTMDELDSLKIKIN